MRINKKHKGSLQVWYGVDCLISEFLQFDNQKELEKYIQEKFHDKWIGKTLEYYFDQSLDNVNIHLTLTIK